MSNFFADAAEWLSETFLDTDNLEFDTDNLRTQSNAIKKINDDFKQLQSNLTSSIDNLRDTWDTDASTVFFEKYDTKWQSQLNEYFALLETLSGDLNYAAGRYEEVKA